MADDKPSGTGTPRSDAKGGDDAPGIVVANNDADQKSPGADDGKVHVVESKEVGGDPAAKRKGLDESEAEEAGQVKKQKHGGEENRGRGGGGAGVVVEQSTLDSIKRRRAALAKIQADPLHQQAVRERNAILTQLLTIQPRAKNNPHGGPGMIEIPVLNSDGKPKMADDVDWIQEELDYMRKLEAGEVDIFDGPPISASKIDGQTYEDCHGGPTDFWKGTWYWEQIWYKGGYLLPRRTSDPTLRTNRKYYDLFKETVENRGATELSSEGSDDPAKKAKEYRDILRLVIRSEDGERAHILQHLLRYAKAHGKSGPGEEPIALVAVRQDQTVHKTSGGCYYMKEASQAVLMNLKRASESAGIDFFAETNDKGESANSVMSAEMKKSMRDRESEEHYAWLEGEQTAAAFDQNYVYQPPPNHCGCNWAEHCCDRFRKRGAFSGPPGYGSDCYDYGDY